MTVEGVLILSLIGTAVFAVILGACFIVSYKKAREFEKELKWRDDKQAQEIANRRIGGDCE